MTAGTAITAAYGVVVIVLLAYVQRLRRRFRQVEADTRAQVTRSPGSALAP